VSGIKGITYNLENGKSVETKLRSEGIFEEETTSNWDQVKVTLPAVKEGSVIDFTYTVTSDFFFNFQDWEFQTTIPVKWSEYRAYIPEYFQYNNYMQGYLALTLNESKQTPNSIMLSYTERSEGRVTTSTNHTEKIDFTENRYRWAIQDVPAFKDEPFMTTRKDFIAKMNFELEFIRMPNQPIKPMLGSWDQINREFYDLYSGEIKGNNFLKDAANQITAGSTTPLEKQVTAGSTTPLEKVVAITNHIKKNVAWDETYSKYFTKNFRKVLDERKGNPAEINLLVASMLEKIGIEAKPVLVSTRDHGFIREMSPASTQFNYTILVVDIDGKKLLIDVTERLLPYHMIPERCLNGSGLVVGAEKFEWLNLETKVKSKTTTTAELTLQNESQLAGKLRRDFSGYAALKKRRNYFVKGEEEYIKDFVGSHAWERKKSEFKNAEDLGNSFTELHDLVVNEKITSAGDVVYIEPFIIDGLNANPFVSETREYPVNFGSPQEHTFLFKLTFPDNYAIEEMPAPKVITLPENSGKFLYNVNVIGSTITITSLLSLNKSMYVQTEYPYLREFYNHVLAKQSEQIVLKKKN
jgi:transglutaminase-like putative cysteine protease